MRVATLRVVLVTISQNFRTAAYGVGDAGSRLGKLSAKTRLAIEAAEELYRIDLERLRMRITRSPTLK
jgi:hypothetical protein